MASVIGVVMVTPVLVFWFILLPWHLRCRVQEAKQVRCLYADMRTQFAIEEWNAWLIANAILFFIIGMAVLASSAGSE